MKHTMVLPLFFICCLISLWTSTLSDNYLPLPPIYPSEFQEGKGLWYLVLFQKQLIGQSIVSDE